MVTCLRPEQDPERQDSSLNTAERTTGNWGKLGVWEILIMEKHTD